MPRPLSDALRVRVRCLGPINPPHTFFSNDAARNRVCLRCAEVIARMHLLPNMTAPVRVLTREGGQGAT